MKKRLFTSLLIAVSMFTAALPAHAQWLNLNNYNAPEVSSLYKAGTHATISVWNTYNQPYGDDITWKLVDLYGFEIATGTVIPWYDEYNDVRSGSQYYTGEFDLEYPYTGGFRLILSCTNSYSCQGEADFEVN